MRRIVGTYYTSWKTILVEKHKKNHSTAHGRLFYCSPCFIIMIIYCTRVWATRVLNDRLIINISTIIMLYSNINNFVRKII